MENSSALVVSSCGVDVCVGVLGEELQVNRLSDRQQNKCSLILHTMAYSPNLYYLRGASKEYFYKNSLHLPQYLYF
jgi:hypothetical protein